MRVIFAGTPAFAASTLQALIESSHTVELVMTQPDRPSGRGMRLQPSPVKQLALAHGLAVAQPMSLRLGGRYADDAQSAQQAIFAAAADVMVVAVQAAAAVLPGVLKARLSLEQDRLRSGTAWVLTLALTPPPTTQGSLLPITLTRSQPVRMTVL